MRNSHFDDFHYYNGTAIHSAQHKKPGAQQRATMLSREVRGFPSCFTTGSAFHVMQKTTLIAAINEPLAP